MRRAAHQTELSKRFGDVSGFIWSGLMTACTNLNFQGQRQ